MFAFECSSQNLTENHLTSDSQDVICVAVQHVILLIKAQFFNGDTSPVVHLGRCASYSFPYFITITTGTGSNAKKIILILITSGTERCRDQLDTRWATGSVS
jgi:hypothetical protein